MSAMQGYSQPIHSGVGAGELGAKGARHGQLLLLHFLPLLHWRPESIVKVIHCIEAFAGARHGI